MSDKGKIVLAYSGGLDTTVILHWLAQQGYEVICYLLDIGQQVEDLDEIGERAKRNGASTYVAVDAREEFLHDYFIPILHANCVYEGRYLLGTSIARPLIAKHQVRIAHETGAQTVCHGATGKGNDQVRFELGYQALDADLKILAPWKNTDFINQFSAGRKTMLDYVEKHGLEAKASRKKPWSSDDNLLHISYEAGVLEDPWVTAPEEIYERMVHPTQAPDEVERFIIRWEAGVPVKVSSVKSKPGTFEGVDIEVCEPDKTLAEGLLPVFKYVDEAAARNGVGSLGMVETRYVGMKSRGEYHSPGHTTLLEAHRDLEGLCLTGSVIAEKERRMADFAGLVYNGYWFDPVAEAHRAFTAATQKFVSGETRVALYKGNVFIEGRRSPYSLYDAGVATMDGQDESYRQEDAAGFIRLHGLPLRVKRKVQGAPEGGDV
ncbi:argininosuccinate synthase [bacterium]|nr:argininosuccinate synthase [bacterium]